MREICSSAWVVIAWIGWSHPSADINHAFQFLRILASLRGDERNLDTLQTERGEPSIGTYFCALNELMTQEYWLRLWFIQELIMGAFPRSSAMEPKSSTGVRSARESVFCIMDRIGSPNTESDTESSPRGVSETVVVGRAIVTLSIWTSAR